MAKELFKKVSDTEYNVMVKIVQCLSDDERKEREDKVISILVENAINMAKKNAEQEYKNLATA